MGVLKRHFWRWSKLIFKGDFCIRLRAKVSVNQPFSKADVYPPLLIEIKYKNYMGPRANPWAYQAHLGVLPAARYRHRLHLAAPPHLAASPSRLILVVSPPRRISTSSPCCKSTLLHRRTSLHLLASSLPCCVSSSSCRRQIQRRGRHVRWSRSAGGGTMERKRGEGGREREWVKKILVWVHLFYESDLTTCLPLKIDFRSWRPCNVHLSVV